MAFSFSSSQLSKVMALGLLLVFFFSDAYFLPLTRFFFFFFLKEREWMRGGGGGIQSHFLSPFCVSGRNELFFPELELGRAFEIQPIFMKVIFLWDFEHNENNPGCVFSHNRNQAISCASSCLIWLKSSPLLISILSSHCVPFAISCAVLANPKTERNNIKLLGWFRQVVVCVCRMPFIWGPQRAWRTLSHWWGPAPT